MIHAVYQYNVGQGTKIFQYCTCPAGRAIVVKCDGSVYDVDVDKRLTNFTLPANRCTS